MQTHFLATKPTKGRPSLKSSYSKEKASPYYWWWAYLKRNADYIKCCENNGKGKLAKLYKDFGDVRDDEFYLWWKGNEAEWEKHSDESKNRWLNQKGQYLFAEMRPPVKVTKLNNASEWQDEWKDEEVIVLAVNLSIGKRNLQKMFSNVLDKEHKGKKGRAALATIESTAKYPLHRNYTTHNLETMLMVYDAWYKNSQLPKAEQVPLWKIGDDLKLVYDAISHKDDLPTDRTAKHNVMASTVSRHLKKAKVIIANTAKGEFPNDTMS